MRKWQTPIWVVLVVGWFIVFVIAGITVGDWLVFTAVVPAIANWVAAAYYFSWLFGIRRHAKRHLNSDLSNAVELSYHPRRQERMDLLTVLTELGKAQSTEIWGLSTGYRSSLLEQLRNNLQTEPLELESFEIAPKVWRDLTSNGVYFSYHNGSPYIVGLVGYVEKPDEDEFSPNRDERALKIVAMSQETCQAVRNELLERARELSPLRGSCLIVRNSGQAGVPEVTGTTIETVERSRIILPEAIFAAVDRTILQQIALADRLERSGQRTRTAILLFGPPGTGKTLLTKYLISQTEGFTTIHLQGFQRSLVRECFRLARYLEPALVVLEDVDLIAVRRQRNQRGTSALHALLDELDGLAPESRCAVIMTTNRPDVLEPALASRPGRVTQAIEFPLPDEQQRQQLLSLFLEKVDASAVDIADWSRKTEGASPAFLEELVRRAVLIALQQNPDSEIAPVTNEDIRQSMQEILSLGGKLTGQLLGHTGNALSKET